MLIFVYEFVTGGGLLSDRPHPLPPASLSREGAAMITALAADLAAIGAAQIVAMNDRRTPLRLPGVVVHSVDSVKCERDTFEKLSAEADWTVVVAPEISNHLLSRCRQVEACGGRLLGPGPLSIQIGSDKALTAKHLDAAGIPVPEGLALEPGDLVPASFGFPAVLKPRLGAGSTKVRLIREARITVDEPSRLEPFCDGLAVSVSFLCGPSGHLALPPCRQHIAFQPDHGKRRLTSGRGDDTSLSVHQNSTITYTGGSLPLPTDLAERATALARRAVESLPDPFGYLGVDLVLDLNGSADKVVEINPRLTTSYVGLRAAIESDKNLAAAMLATCRGEPYSLSFRPTAIEFDSDGTVRRGHADMACA
jgi:predicted ATP-grasp superfamily ATP-dependent carboligase